MLNDEQEKSRNNNNLQNQNKLDFPFFTEFLKILKKRDIQTIKNKLIKIGFTETQNPNYFKFKNNFYPFDIYISLNFKNKINIHFDNSKGITIEFSTNLIKYFYNSELIKEFELGTAEKESVELISSIFSILPNSIEFFNFNNFKITFGRYSVIYHYAKYICNKRIHEKSKILEDFERWRSILSRLYNKKYLNVELFIRYSYFYLILEIILYSCLFSKKDFESYSISECHKEIDNKNIHIQCEFFNWINEIVILNKVIFIKLKGAQFEIEDIFQKLFENLILDEERHMTGEFYTPNDLAQFMIENSYKIGDRVLDPACGSGTFLIAIIKKIFYENKNPKEIIEAIKNIYGFEINPLAVIMSKVNLIIHLTQRGINEYPINVFHCDTIFTNFNGNSKMLFDNSGKKQLSKEKVDLIVGNPPWLVLKSIHSNRYKNEIKNKSKELGIFLGGIYCTSTELSTIFFAQCSKNYLKDEGVIFFVMTNSILFGAQHGKFRIFKGFKNIEIWDFNKDIFRIHSICLKANKGYEPINQRLNIKKRYYNVENSELTREFTLIKRSIYVPYNIENIHNDSDEALRLVPLEIKKELLPIKDSYYRKSVYNGACIFPRNILFVKILEKKGNLLKIIPNIEDFKGKEGWHKKPYKSSYVESSYIFKCVKSSELIPFKMLGDWNVFLPINNNFQFDDEMKDNAKKHYEKIENFFKIQLKKGSSIKSLWERINYVHGMTNPSHNKKNKVVFNSIGSIVKSAILMNQEVIDTNLFYFGLDNLDEGYYLMGILNSSVITNSVKYLGSVGAHGSLRSIHKRPFYFPIPKYNSKKQTHLKIVSVSKELESFVNSFVIEWRKKELKKKSKYIKCIGCGKIFIKSNMEMHKEICSSFNITELSYKDIIPKPRSIQNSLLKNTLFIRKLDIINTIVEKVIINNITPEKKNTLYLDKFLY